MNFQFINYLNKTTMTFKITIPKNWNPECTKSINRWFKKIDKHVIKSKI